MAGLAVILLLAFLAALLAPKNTRNGSELTAMTETDDAGSGLSRSVSHAQNVPVTEPNIVKAEVKASKVKRQRSSRKDGPTVNKRDPFADAEVLELRESEPDAKGHITRVKLLRTQSKYPLVRVEEKISVDSSTRRETVISHTAMIADHIVVRLKPGQTEDNLRALNLKHGADIRKDMGKRSTYLVEFTGADADTVAEAVEAYEREAQLISYAEPDYVVYAVETIPNDSRFNELWGMHNTGQSGGTVDADIDAAEAWDTGTGTDVIVAVVDTGVDYDHEDLAANMWVNPGEIAGNGIDDDNNGYVDDVHGIDAVNTDTDPKDDNSHGTHCAGTIAGVGNNSVGVAGVCWSARIMGLKFLSAGGWGSTSDAITCVDYAALMGARVMNNSWGGGGYSQAMYDAIEDAASSNSLFVAAAGNNGTDNDSIAHYPSTYTNDSIIAVAASDRTEALSYFSCYGLTTVDLAAPGSAILSCTPNDGYASYNGTSMATPHVAGAAALLLSRNSNLSLAELKAALMDSVDPKPAYAGKMVSGGRLNVFNALQKVYGVAFDENTYFVDDWVGLRLVDNGLAGNGTQVVNLWTSDGDAETLTLTETSAGGYIFTNRLWLAGGVANPGNGQFEAGHDTVLYASYYSPTASGIVTGSSTVELFLDIKITTLPQDVAYAVTDFQVQGENNGNVFVGMMVSNEATGEAISFAATNDWLAPAVALATNKGVNRIWVIGTNVYGHYDAESVDITRLSPAGVTNYVSVAGNHTWPYLSWQTASTNINMAIDVGPSGNVVLVTNGTYAGEEIIVSREVQLRSVNGPDSTIIDGEYARRCLSIKANAVVDGFTIKRGYADDNGGGVSMYDGILRNCAVIDNEAYDYGGGVYCELKGLIDSCNISSNTAWDGGGVEIYYADCVVSNCTINQNYAYSYGGGVDCYVDGEIYATVLDGNYAGWYGGGVSCYDGGDIYECTIINNEAWDGGGVECYYGSDISINNSLIAGNLAEGYGGGVDMWVGGEIKGCTIIDNEANTGGGVYCYYAGDIRNSIIYYNAAPNGDNYNDYNGYADFEYTCTVPEFTGLGNLTNEPSLIGMRNPHLLAGSLCIDAGTNGYASGFDIDGEARISNGTVDIGADEWIAGGLTGSLSVAIIADVTSFAVGYPVGFNSDIQGRVTYFTWDFSGTMYTNMPSVNHAWGAQGSYDVVLTAYNIDNPGGISATQSVTVLPAYAYVSLTGGNVSPYDSWSNAAINIQDAIDVSPLGGRVVVTDGVYNVGSYIKSGYGASRIGIDKPVTVESVNGPAVTIIQGTGPQGTGAVRCVYMDTGAVLSGFTLTNGHTVTSGSLYRERVGGGALLDGGGMITNCVISGNSANYRGGGTYAYYGGKVIDSTISGNTVNSYGGGAACYYGGSIEGCLIEGNSSGYNGGGTYCYYGGTVERCKIISNTASQDGGGHMGYSSSSLNNCHISGN
ncbi:hypothetical protein BVX97_03940, partial [bacterium E08(2017)]